MRTTPRHRFTRALSRRQALGVLGAAAGAVTAACGGETATSPTTTTTTTTTTTGTNAACVVTPSETAGPYPSRADFVRSDIREDRQGTALTLTITVVNANSGCAPVANAEVEIWHCDVAGDYSQYGSQTARTFLRGIQTTNAAGQAAFTTIYPGWYQGRATHIHAEVTVGGRSVKVTQMAFPESVNNTVHTSGVYASRGTNPTANLSDGIFADSLAAELVTPAGSPSGGYTAAFQIAVQV
jgi:protocatechuate 3,4-dioxygenase beta subunit